MTATRLPDPAAPTHKGRSLALRFVIAFLAGVLLVAGLGGGALYAYGQQYSGKVLPGVKIGDLDLSGHTSEQASAAIADGYASLGDGAITLRGPGGDMTIGYAEIGRHADIDSMVKAALLAGRHGEPVADLLGAPRAALRGVSVEPAVTYDEVKLAAAVAAVARAVDRPAVDATLVKNKAGEFVTTESVDGRIVDQAALVKGIGTQLARLDAPAEIRAEIPYTTNAAAVTTTTVEDARAAAERMAQDMVLTRGSTSWTIPGKVFRDLITIGATDSGHPGPVLDPSGIMPEVKKIAADVDLEPRNATFKMSGSKVVFSKASKDGRRLSRYGTEDVILAALRARGAGQPEGRLAPVVVVRHPTVTTAQAKTIAPRMKEISHWTTYFPVWSHNANGANIWIPASIINGYVVGPGETFDFWEVVGEVNRAKGYGLGGAIINGKTEAQGAIGGGICSCSTTLFNAALRAGFKMGDRKNHYYSIDRYPTGLDATVFISAGGQKQTMSWTNDTKYPVLIRGINTRSGNRGYVTFRLYSVPTNRKVSISAPTIKNVRKATDTTERSSILRAGYSGRLEYPVNGMDVWRTVTVRENGKVIRKTTYYSRYSVITGVVIIGTGGPGAPTKLP